MSYQNIHKNLLEELKNDSYQAFDKIYAIYSDMLYGFVLQLTKSPEVAKDVLQETFLRIWLLRKDIDTNKSFKSYLYRIAQNYIIDRFRKQVKQVSFENYINSDFFLEYSRNNIEEGIDYDNFLIILNNAKLKMTDRQREIFIMNKEKGFSTSYIAEKLNVSEKTVQNMISASLRILREEILPILTLLSIIK